MFEIKPYTRKELAYIYFPNSFTPKSACLSFRRLLEKCPKGIELKKTIQYKKHLSTPDVEAIVEIVGRP
ncbi:MAG: DUF4248 domain-containing protein [Chitinophagales bacterium]|nr:DUF4248 domain-containing protein [Chitinophagales bacterium]